MSRRHILWMLPVGTLCLCSFLWAERMRLPEGTPIRVRLKADLSADRAQEGNRVDFEVAQPVFIQGLVVIPEGAVAWGAVQSVRKKEIRFDVEGIKLVNQQEIRLRTLREKSKNPGKDLIKVETKAGDTAVAARGNEYTAYVDQDVDLEGTPAPAAAVPAPKTAPVAKAPEVPKPTPAPATETPAARSVPKTAPPVAVGALIGGIAGKGSSVAPKTPPAGALIGAIAGKGSSVAPKTTPATETPAVSNPPLAAPAPTPTPVAEKPGAVPAPAAPPPELLATTERITVECFSDPSAADILIDGNFVGNTPSILKVPVGNHRLEFQLAGYKTITEPLDVVAGMEIRTIRKTLAKVE